MTNNTVYFCILLMQYILLVPHWEHTIHFAYKPNMTYILDHYWLLSLVFILTSHLNRLII